MSGSPIGGTASPRLAMSIDVEDWFHVQNLSSAIPRETWADREDRVARNTRRMLELLEETGARATCFVLGVVADRHPDLVREIAKAGHEIACHGQGHELVYDLSPEAFREDVRRSKRTLEDLCGTAVVGYRAPNFSITDWAIDVLAEEGYRWDSSSFPVVAHDRYGRLTGAPPGADIYELRQGFDEVCVSCLNVLGRGVPWGGGGYFRLLPYAVFSRGVRSIVGSGRPYVFYIHPWEIDPDQPRVGGLSKSHAFRHYVNLDRCEARWKRLLSEFRWGTIGDLLAA